MFEKYIINYLKNNPEEILKYLKKNQNFKKYELIFNRHIKNSGDFKSAVFSTESNIESIIEGLIYSTTTRNQEELDSESRLLACELEEALESSKDLN